MTRPVPPAGTAPALLENAMNYEIIAGDCLQSLRTLPAQSVQTCVTSPPYYGLRDYGTAQYEGGDPGCKHTICHYSDPKASAERPHRYDRSVCLKCGARRIDAQIGLEETPEAYVAKLVEVFREVRRVLKDDGVLWLNLGDSYNGSGGAGGDYSAGGLKEGQPKYPGRNISGLGPKQLLGIPWRVAFALQADGWVLRSEIIWHKKAPMPESVTDRPTKAHEQLFLLAKSASYYYDADAIREQQEGDGRKRGCVISDDRIAAIDYGGKRREAQDTGTRNKRSVWTLGPESFNDAHFATMPTKLVEPCILAGSKPGDTVLDPFSGSGTTIAVALKYGRRGLGCELNPAYIEMAHKRIARTQPSFLQEIT